MPLKMLGPIGVRPSRPCVNLWLSMRECGMSYLDIALDTLVECSDHSLCKLCTYQYRNTATEMTEYRMLLLLSADVTAFVFSPRRVPKVQNLGGSRLESPARRAKQ